jgi:hypothetical protein
MKSGSYISASPGRFISKTSFQSAWAKKAGSIKNIKELIINILEKNLMFTCYALSSRIYIFIGVFIIYKSKIALKKFVFFLRRRWVGKIY